MGITKIRVRQLVVGLLAKIRPEFVRVEQKYRGGSVCLQRSLAADHVTATLRKVGVVMGRRFLTGRSVAMTFVDAEATDVMVKAEADAKSSAIRHLFISRRLYRQIICVPAQYFHVNMNNAEIRIANGVMWVDGSLDPATVQPIRLRPAVKLTPSRVNKNARTA